MYVQELESRSYRLFPGPNEFSTNPSMQTRRIQKFWISVQKPVEVFTDTVGFFGFVSNIPDLLEGGVSRRVVGARGGDRRFCEGLGVRSSGRNETRNRTKSSLVAVGESYVFDGGKKKRKSVRKIAIRRSCRNGTRV